MLTIVRQISVLMLLLLSYSQITWAAPALASTPVVQSVAGKQEQPILQSIRYSLTPQKVRLVFNVTTLPIVAAELKDNPDQLVIDFEGLLNKVNAPTLLFNDPIVTGLQLSDTGIDKQQVVINVTKAVTYKIFTLANPNRVVIDINKDVDQKIEEQIVPGIKYTSFLRSMPAGPISAHIVEMNLDTGYMVKPILSNDAISGLERLESMAERNKAIAAINGSYFALNGEVLGLLKLDGDVASTSYIDRTAIGILPSGKVLMDAIDYKGSITLPDGRSIAITGVNHERGTNDLILYNNYFDSMTGTNAFGTDYILSNGKVVAISHGNAGIPPGGVVLSAHGTMEKVLGDLKLGDTVKISQTLGAVWDKTIDVMGAGPRLIKNGSIFLTTKQEEFPSDIAIGRAPRTAVGVTKEGHLLLFVVDGRQQASIGMTLLELALFMQELGAVDAMNLDGGGSSEMVINGRQVNNPSDGRERPIGTSLMIMPKN
jgi:exopolysaccharide biosynthesis protein